MKSEKRGHTNGTLIIWTYIGNKFIELWPKKKKIKKIKPPTAVHPLVTVIPGIVDNVVKADMVLACENILKSNHLAIFFPCLLRAGRCPANPPWPRAHGRLHCWSMRADAHRRALGADAHCRPLGAKHWRAYCFTTICDPLPQNQA